MPRDTELGVFEIGTNHPGEIGPLSKLVNPDLAIVLNVLPVHIGHFEHFNALVQRSYPLLAALKPEPYFAQLHLGTRFERVRRSRAHIWNQRGC